MKVSYSVLIGIDGYAYLFVNGILSKRFPNAGNSIEEMARSSTFNSLVDFIEKEKMAKILSLTALSFVSLLILAEIS